MNTNPNTPFTPTRDTIIVAKPYNIPVTNPFSVTNTSNMLPIPIPILQQHIRQLLLSFPKLSNVRLLKYINYPYNIPVTNHNTNIFSIFIMVTITIII